ncbi:MAG TPA: AMP-binding protein, partial [Acidimicrobiales bacterium]
MEFNLAEVFDTVARAVPDRECLVWRDLRLTYAQMAERSNRLGNYLHEQGLGSHRDRSELQGHESGQDHLALYLYNGNEYLEGMLGGYKAR